MDSAFFLAKESWRVWGLEVERWIGGCCWKRARVNTGVLGHDVQAVFGDA